MSSSKTSNTKFWILTGFTLIAAGAGLAALTPWVPRTMQGESNQLTRTAKANGGMATADYELALWLNPGNQPARLRLAASQVTGGQPAAALATLKSAGAGSEATELSVRAGIEAGRYTSAADAATRLLTTNPTNANYILASLAYALANRPADARSLISRVTSPQAATAISRANAAPITLAAELCANGLLRSSSVTLKSLTPSYERSLLLARIDYTLHSSSDLTHAANLLNTAVSLNPSSLEARELLVKVDKDRGDTAGLKAQATLIAKLQNGRP